AAAACLNRRGGRRQGGRRRGGRRRGGRWAIEITVLGRNDQLRTELATAHAQGRAVASGCGQAGYAARDRHGTTRRDFGDRLIGNRGRGGGARRCIYSVGGAAIVVPVRIGLEVTILQLAAVERRRKC